MTFVPQPGNNLHIDGAIYTLATHPAAPGMPHGQEGRQAVVYQVLTGDEKRALKVFKPHYRVPALSTMADHLAPLAALPGLSVCRRTVLSARRHIDLLRQYPDLTYAVLMPWIAGPTWMEVLAKRLPLATEQSLMLARSLADVLADMEEHGLAHCDLSGPNILLPALASQPTADNGSIIELVDVEQTYGSDLKRPEVLPAGSPGYAHHSASQGLWASTSDRFAGAILIAEMLCWCDPRVREASWGESYFDPKEMQQDSKRYDLLASVLSERWGNATAALLNRAWASDTTAYCPTFGEWLVNIPDAVPAASQAAPVEPITKGPVISSSPSAGMTSQSTGLGVPPAERPAQVDTDLYSPSEGPSAPLPRPSLRMGARPGATKVVAGVGDTKGESPTDGLVESQLTRLDPIARRAPSRKWVAMPAILVVFLVSFGAIGLYQAQAITNANANATATAQVELREMATLAAYETATAVAQQSTASAASTQQAVRALATEISHGTSTAVAQVTATGQAIQAEETRVAQSHATSEAQITLTAEALALANVQASATSQAALEATVQARNTAQAVQAIATQQSRGTATAQAKIAATVKASQAGIPPTVAKGTTPSPTKLVTQPLAADLSTPLQIAPTDGSTFGNATQIVFHVAPVSLSGTIFYVYEFDRGDAGGGNWQMCPRGGYTLPMTTELGSGAAMAVGFPPGRTYRWRVKAVYIRSPHPSGEYCAPLAEGDLESTWSSWWSFTIKGAPTEQVISSQVAAPEQLAPDDGATFTSGGVMRWSDVPGASYYILEYYWDVINNPGFSTPNPDCTSAKPCSSQEHRTESAVALPYAVKIHWRVGAVDASGLEGPRSPWREYTRYP